jgi:hypothetical protein
MDNSNENELIDRILEDFSVKPEDNAAVAKKGSKTRVSLAILKASKWFMGE